MNVQEQNCMASQEIGMTTILRKENKDVYVISIYMYIYIFLCMELLWIHRLLDTSTVDFLHYRYMILV